MSRYGLTRRSVRYPSVYADELPMRPDSVTGWSATRPKVYSTISIIRRIIVIMDSTYSTNLSGIKEAVITKE